MIQIFRSGTYDTTGFDRHSELCIECAKKEVKDGFYVEYDLYLSEKTDVITKEDTCQICGDTFFIDGRSKIEKVKGIIY